MLKDKNDLSSYSDNFIFWARKTEHLSDKEWTEAFAELERKVVVEARSGKDPWPPSYAEFVAMAKKTISPNGGNADAYLSLDDPRHSCYRPKRPAIEDFGKKAKLEKVQTETLSNLKGLFK